MSNISPSTASFGAAAAAGNISVTAPQNCAWSASSNAAWLLVTSASAGTGNGSIAFAVEQNQTTSSRTGAITIGERTFTVTQSGEPASCGYTVSPVDFTFGAAGGANTVTVSTRSDCAWSASSGQSWVTITSGASGTGNGVVAVSVAANTGDTARTGTLTVGGQTVTVRQDRQAPCAVDIVADSAWYAAAAAAGTFTVTTPQQCAWSATSNAPWLTFTSASSGTGSSSVAYAVARNTDASPRTGTIVVGSRTFTVTQLGDTPTCDYSVSPVAFNACMGSTMLIATVTTQQGCIMDGRARRTVDNGGWRPDRQRLRRGHFPVDGQL